MKRAKSAWEISHPIPEATLLGWRELKAAQRSRWVAAARCVWCGRLSGAFRLCEPCRRTKNAAAIVWRLDHPEVGLAYAAACRAKRARVARVAQRDQWQAVRAAVDGGVLPASALLGPRPPAVIPAPTMIV